MTSEEVKDIPQSKIVGHWRHGEISDDQMIDVLNAVDASPESFEFIQSCCYLNGVADKVSAALHEQEFVANLKNIFSHYRSEYDPDQKISEFARAAFSKRFFFLICEKFLSRDFVLPFLNIVTSKGDKIRLSALEKLNYPKDIMLPTLEDMLDDPSKEIRRLAYQKIKSILSAEEFSDFLRKIEVDNQRIKDIASQASDELKPFGLFEVISGIPQNIVSATHKVTKAASEHAAGVISLFKEIKMRFTDDKEYNNALAALFMWHYWEDGTIECGEILEFGKEFSEKSISKEVLDVLLRTPDLLLTKELVDTESGRLAKKEFMKRSDIDFSSDHWKKVIE